MIRITHKGNFNDTKVYLEHAAECSNPKKLNEYAMKGLAALIAATPVDSGKTAASWSYEHQQECPHRNYIAVWTRNSKWRLGAGKRLY